MVWVFDQSSCHKPMASDTLDVAKMNVNPGGKQSRMMDLKEENGSVVDATVAVAERVAPALEENGSVVDATVAVAERVAPALEENGSVVDATVSVAARVAPALKQKEPTPSVSLARTTSAVTLLA